MHFNVSSRRKLLRAMIVVIPIILTISLMFSYVSVSKAFADDLAPVVNNLDVESVNGKPVIEVNNMTKTSDTELEVSGSFTLADGTTLVGAKLFISPTDLMWMNENFEWTSGDDLVTVRETETGNTYTFEGSFTLTPNDPYGCPEIFIGVMATDGTDEYVGFGPHHPVIVCCDTQAPQGSVIINNGQQTTYSLGVSLSVACTEVDLYTVEVSNNQTNWTTIPVAGITNPVSWSLTEGTGGTRTVYIRLTDDVGNSSITSATINYSTDIPVPEQISKALALLQKLAALDNGEVRFLLNLAYDVLEYDVLTQEQKDLLAQAGLTKTDVRDALDVIGGQGGLLYTDADINALRNAVSDPVDWMFLVDFFTTIKNSVPQEYKNKLAERGLTVEELVFTAFSFSDLSMDFLTVTDELKVSVDQILTERGIYDSVSKQVLANYGVNWENFNRLIECLAQDNKLDQLRSILDKISSYTLPPQANLTEGTYYISKKVSLSVNTTNQGNIYWIRETADTARDAAYIVQNGHLYSQEIDLAQGSADVTYYIKAVRKLNDKFSAVKVWQYTIKASLAAPQADPPGGTYPSVKMVALTGTVGATIYYTEDGRDPKVYGKVYTSLIPVNQNKTIKAAAVMQGVWSDVATFNYIIQTGGITGYLKYAKDNSPISGATVKVGPRSTITDSTGKYVFSGVGQGTYTVITANGKGYTDKEQQVTVAVGDPAQCDFQLYRGGTVSGTVQTTNGSPIAGVTVGIYSAAHTGSGYTGQAQTGVNGSFWIENLRTGTEYVVYTSNSEGYLDQSVENVSITRGALTELSTPISLSKPAVARLSGTLTDNNLGVQNAWIYAWSYSTGSWAQAVTDANGSFVVDGTQYTLLPANDYEISYYKWEDQLWGNKTGITLAVGDNAIHLIAPPATTVSGTVYDNSNQLDPKPVSGLYLYAPGYGGTVTKSDGSYELKVRLPEGTNTITLELDLWNSDLIDKRTDKTVNVSAGNVEDYNIELIPGFNISGSVSTTPDESANQGVWVYAWSQNANTWRSARTDGNGDYKITGIALANDYTISADKYGYISAVHEDVSVTGDTGLNLSLVHESFNAQYFKGNGNRFIAVNNVAAPGSIVNFRLDYKNNNNLAATGINAEFTLPTGLTFETGTVRINNTSVAGTWNAGTGKLTVPLGNIADGSGGTVTFQAKIAAATNVLTLRTSADLVWDRTESMGTAFVDIVTVELNAPTLTKPGQVAVYGICADGAKITVWGKKTEDTVYVELAKASADGKWWNAFINLPSEGTYQIKAEATKNNVVNSSEVKTVEVKSNVSVLQDVTVNAAWNKDVRTNPRTGIPAIAAAQGNQVYIDATFSLDLTQTPQIIFALKRGETNTAVPANFHINSNMSGSGKNWSGSFSIPYDVSGDRKVFIRYYNGEAWVVVPVVQIQVLIDPSGIVTDAHTGLPVTGVKAVCEYLDNGIWKFWPAANFGQVNPQYTDANGAYGWDVPAGTYRVVFTHPDYETFVSENVVVPPPKTDLDPGMVSLVSLVSPGVEMVQPGIGASAIATNNSIKVTFTKDMNMTTVDAATFTVTDSNATPVAGTITADAANPNRVAVFTPNALLNNSETYTVTLKTGITDVFGNQLPQEFSWSFTTIAAVTLVDIQTNLTHYGRNMPVSITGTLFINGNPAGAGENLSVSIIKPDMSQEAINNYVTDAGGMFNEPACWTVPADAAAGTYTVEVSYNGAAYNKSFEVLVVSAPTADVASGTYYATQTVTLTAAPGADIYYTTDGTSPTTASTRYTGAITVSATTTLKAIALINNVTSTESEYSYTITTAPAGGGGGGGGGGVVPPVTEASKNIFPATGGTLTLADVSVTIPAAALQANATISIKKLSSSEAEQTVPSGLRIKLSSDVFEINTTGSRNFEKDIIIKLPFSPAKIADGEEAKIHYYDENAKQWVALETTIVEENGKKLAVVKVNHLTKFAVFSVKPEVIQPPAKTFADLVGHWAKADIEAMLSLGLVAGVSDTDFAPNRTITRAEFAALLARAAGIEAGANATNKFTDVAAGKWYAQVVNAAAAAGLVSGYSATTFGPDDQITREQMAAMVTRALAYKGKGVVLTEEQVIAKLNLFKDNTQVSAWARTSVASAVETGIVAGRTADTFVPKANATRAEGAVMIYRLYNQI